jgi:hypothetical protein
MTLMSVLILLVAPAIHTTTTTSRQRSLSFVKLA